MLNIKIIICIYFYFIVKISWGLSAVNIDRPFNISSNTATFGSGGEPSNGEVYRYFAFIDSYKQAISIDEDGSIKKKLYNFIDPSQLWRIGKYTNYTYSFSFI